MASRRSRESAALADRTSATTQAAAATTTAATSAAATSDMRLVLQDGVDALVRQARTPVQRKELDQKGKPVHVTAESSHQVGRGLGRAARRQQIVDNQHTLAAGDRVRVNLERVAAVLQFVCRAHRT